jgi:peptidoglycan-associated lipoprotein
MLRVALLVMLIAACHHATPAPTTPPSVVEAPAPKLSPPAQQASPNVYVSDELAKQCTLHMDNAQQAPKFDYDAASLEAADRDVLQAIAQCVTSGPLKGRRLELTGRADPRGTEEYNLGLGSRRAGSVGDFLQHLGVGHQQLAQTTRGALDASGNDESGWKQDRRVDITLQ